MKTITNQIKDCIEDGLDRESKIIIFPYGDIGVQVSFILKTAYDIEPAYIIDNRLCRYNSKIKDISFLSELNPDQYVLLLASTNPDIYEELRSEAKKHFDGSRIIELECMRSCRREAAGDEIDESRNVEPSAAEEIPVYTKCGKYSYGPLCNHFWVESVGAFCSFDIGSDVVANHATEYITTHPIMYASRVLGRDKDYDTYKDQPWYLPGLNPRGQRHKGSRVKIGNDVWLGRNVLITNGAKIGNGVIAGAGSVITRDVPDYAVVVGVPARIIRYRYSQEEIAALNRISWWNWTDDEIRARFEDFYLSIGEFIKKYDVNVVVK